MSTTTSEKTCSQPGTPEPVFFDISMPRIEAAAKARFGANTTVGPAYWLDSEVLRFPVSLDDGNLSFGANYHFREGCFR